MDQVALAQMDLEVRGPADPFIITTLMSGGPDCHDSGIQIVPVQPANVHRRSIRAAENKPA